MLGGATEEKPVKKGKKGKKRKGDDDAVDSPRPMGMPPAYPITDVSTRELFDKSDFLL